MIEGHRKGEASYHLSWIPLAFILLLFTASIFGETKAPSTGEEQNSVTRETPEKAQITRIEFTKKVERELKEWKKRVEEVKKQVVTAPKVGGRQRHLRDTARYLESKSREVESDLSELQTADAKLWAAIQTKIDLKLEEMRATYSAVVE